MPQFVTGEAVAVDLRTAAVPSRLLAGGIDAALQVLLYLGISALRAAVAPSVSLAADSALGLAVLVLVGVGYPVAFEALLRGRTPGKLALGLRVVRDDAGPIGFRQALVRGLAGAFLEKPGITLFVGALIPMALDSRGKRIGDLLAGTVVLQERVVAPVGPLAAMPPGLQGWAEQVDLSGVTDDLALSARQFLARQADLTPAAREALGGQLVAAVLRVVAPAAPPGTPGWAVLAATLAERRRREERRFSAAAGATASAAAAAAAAAGQPGLPLPAEPAPAPGPGGFALPG